MAFEAVGTSETHTRSKDLVVETTRLSKRYSAAILAVDSLELQVRRGEVYGFLGPNGAGKTTTLRMLLGLIEPSSGTALVAGHAPGAPEGLAKIGAMVETPAFYPYMSGRDNLRVFTRYAMISDAGVDAALARVDLSSRAKDKFSTYSLGMKQRLGVAAALVKEPELLILDEPANGLDPQGIVEMRDMLRDFAKEGLTVLVSSHLLGEVQQFCDRVGVIQRGRMMAQGTVEEIRGGAKAVSIRATPIDKAKEVLSGIVGADAVSGESDGWLQVAIDPERSWEINRALNQADIHVSELRLRERSLEDVFLELTGKESGL